MDSATKTFYLKETSAPPDYVPNGAGYTVTVSATNNSTKETAAAVNGGVAIKNGKSQPPSGVVQKVDPDGNGIGPATFHFKKLTPNAVDMDIPCDETGTLKLQWEDPSKENYIEPGEYTVTEVIPPPGYEKSEESQNLRLWLEDKDGDGIQEPYSSGPIVFQNQPKHTVIIQKVDETGNGLPGAVFDVYFNGAKVDSVTTGPDGTFNYTGTDGNGVSTGTWEFVETKAPSGYLIPYMNYQSVTVNTLYDDVRVHTLTFVNYTYPEIVIQKVAAGNDQPLAGAVFEVMVDGTNLGRFGPTGPDGTIIINHDVYGEFLKNDKQDSWTVQVREVEAPEGYLIDDTNWQTAEISRGTKLAPFVFTDTKYPEIVIRKSDRETEEMLPGATFDIKIDAGASFNLTKQTDENGEIWITYDDYAEFIGDIVWDRGWTVTVTETVMPDKYNRDPQPESDGGAGFTVTKQLLPGQSLLEFDFTDTHYRDLLVVKSDASNSWRLADAKFKLESINLDDPAAGGTVSREGTTDANGELLFKDLPNGTYKLTELTPPTGYDMPDPHEWTITVTSMSDRVIQIAVENEPREGLTITKHDAITGKPLAGVEFSIRYLGDGNDSTDTSNEPRTYTTDSNGIIHLPDAVPGWYQIIETRVPDGYIIDSEPRLVQLVNAHDTVVVNFHNYQDTQLIILKKDNQTGLPLAGARFMVTTAGGNFIADLVTGSTGYATLNGLEPGSYVVKEVEAPDGHIIDSTPQTFELRVGQTEPVFLVFGNDGKTTLYIRKEDEQTRLPVAGAVFKLSRVNGEVIKERLETGLDGLASIGDLLPGDYVVEEIEAPKGYLLSENPKQNVSLKAGEVATVLFRNNKPGGVAILKQDAMSGLPLEGAKFTVTRLDGSPVGKEPYYVTGKDGYIRVPGLEAGYYYVQEIEAPEGYLLDSTRHQVRVENFEVTLLQLKNYEKTTLVVEKVDAQSKVPLAGAEFGLFAMDGKQIGDPFITGTNGKANLTGIDPGWYILKELKAPIGYVLNEDEFRVEVKEGQPTTITVQNTPESGITVRKVDATTKNPLAGAQFELRDQDNKLLGNYQTDPTGSFVTVNVGPGTYYLIETKAPAGYTIVNERTEVKVAEGEKPVVIIENHKDSSIQILKTDSVSGKYLEGAEFEVKELNTNRVVGTYTTDRAGIAFTEPLPAGNYIVTEIKAPCGYILDETHHHVEVKPNTPSILRVTNTALTGIMVTKVSTVDDEPLMGAKFEIRTAEGRVLGEVTTDTTGTATYPIATPGVYYVKEVEQPDGYLLDETVHRVEVVEGQLATLVVENAPMASLVIFKGDADTGRGVAGAVFEVYHADGAFIGRYTTDAQGEALIRPIEPGHYIVREVAAPDGYELPNVTEKTVTVKAGQINRVTFEDLAYGSLIVRLEDKADGHQLPNGRFQLIVAKTGEMIMEGVTGNDGTIIWGNLPAGDYIVKQTYAPDGYTMTETEIRATVVSNETRTVVFQNVTSGIVIEKLDRVTSAPLPNARFQVTRNSDNIVIGEYVTDEDGLALVGGLTPGMYTVEELAAPTGYEMDAPSQLVHVKDSEFAHATFTDTPYAGITVNAVDQSNQPLAGVVIEIWRQNGELINTWTTNNTGVVQTDKLTSGYYVIKVIKNPDGYIPNVTETTVQIQNGVAVNVRLVFNAGGTLNIYGVDAAEKGLAGMRVEVTTIDGTRVGTYTTDAAGIIRVPGLDIGWYVVTVTKAPDGYTLSEVNQSQNVEITSDGTAQVRFQFGKTYASRSGPL